MKRVLLLNMPFCSTVSPSIGLSLLKAAATRDGIPCDIRYLNLLYAARIGSTRYEGIANNAHALLGEWLFAEDLFADAIPPPEAYLAQLLKPRPEESVQHGTSPSFGPEHAPEILNMHAGVRLFLDECMAAIRWEDYALVGFTTMFQQNVASLALARRIKNRYPDMVIAFGGANCEGEMGPALHRLFPFIDYVCSGEGDLNFPWLARQVLASEPVGEIPGIIRRVNQQSVPPEVPAAMVRDMDALPTPEYDDFVEQRQAVNLPNAPESRLMIETSRGCWWGQKSHCTFCGLNGLTMEFRVKSAERVLTELTALIDRYHPHIISAVDNIIDMRYFRDVLPHLAELPLDVELFYETKANLRKDQVRMLREARITRIQPGIESLNSNVLRIMRKGVSATQNIQLLRWCAEYMVRPYWNLLVGFPGEDPADYARQAEIVPLLMHLTPPDFLLPVRLDRFSPMYVHPEEMGVRNIRAFRPYSYIYPFSDEDIKAIAYFFEFDYADNQDPRSYTGDLQHQLNIWTSEGDHGQLTSLVDRDVLVICDTRAVGVQAEYRLTGLRRAVYDYCDQAHSRSQIEAHLATLPLEQTVAADLDTVLDEFVTAKLVLYEDGRYLSLAVAADYWVKCLLEHQAAHNKSLPVSLQEALNRLLDPRVPALTQIFGAKLRSVGAI